MNNSVLNTFQWNDQNLAVGAGAVSSYDDIEFDGYSLQSASVISSVIEAERAPRRELRTVNTPRNDGGAWQGDYMRERTVRVSGIIKADTASQLETLLDTFKRRMTTPEGNLDRKINGAMRRCTATLQNSARIFARRKGHHVTICPFDLEFLCLDPMWKDFDYTSETEFNVTSLVHPASIINEGSYKAPLVLLIIVDAASGISKVNLTSSTNGDEVEITTTINAGDIIIIDSENYSVTINGTEVEYDGVFPFLDYGTNNYTITFTGTSIEYTPTAKFKKHYL